jgi:hypothetical protein
MKRVLLIVVAIALLGYAVIVGLDRGPPPEKPFAFANASITLPEDKSIMPPGPNVDVVMANCTACHSATMLTTQPPLKPEQWAATIKKMREVYKAPVADSDVPAITQYLEAMSARQEAAGR